MKNLFQILTLIVLIDAALITGCNLNNAKRIEETRKSVALVILELNQARVSYEEEWPGFKADAESKIEVNERSIAKFKKGIKSDGIKYSSGYMKNITGLELKNKELMNVVNNFKYDGKEKWDDFKLNFDYEMDSMGKAIKRLYAKIN